MKHKIFILTVILFLFPITAFSGAWLFMESGTSNGLNGIWANSGSDIFAVGYNGTILHYDGSAWSPMNSDTDTNLQGIWGASSTNVFAVGTLGYSLPPPPAIGGGVVYKSSILQYNGFFWSTTYNKGGELLGIWGFSGEDVLAVGDYTTPLFGASGGQIIKYDGSIWSLQLPLKDEEGADSFSSIWGSSPTDIFFIVKESPYPIFGGGGNDTIYHFDGINWTKMYSSNSESLEAIWGSSSRDVYVVGRRVVGLDIQGCILHYDGNIWSEIEGLTSNTLYGVWGSSENDVFIVGEKGTILHFDGSNWNQIDNYTGSTLRGVGGFGTDVFAVGYGGTILHLEQSWDTAFIKASCLPIWIMLPSGQKTESRWLVLICHQVNHFMPEESIIKITNEYEESWGVILDSNKTPLKIGALIFIPIKIEYYAFRPGKWTVRIFTQVDDIKTMEVITADFRVMKPPVILNAEEDFVK